MDQFISSLLVSIEQFRLLGYGMVFLVSFLESLAFVGTVIPGALFVVFAGSLAAKGYFDLGDLLWFAAAGAVLGDGVSFRLGRRSHILFSETNRIFKTSHLARGKEFFARYGGAGVLFGRFNGLIRAVVPFVAGIAGMDGVRFYVWNVTGAFAWGASHLLAGYILGAAWRTVEVWTTRFGAVLAAILLLLLGIYLLKRFLERRGRFLLTLLGSVAVSLKEALVTNPEVRKLVAAHPRFCAFVAERFDRRRFTGLPLTLLGLSFLYVLLLLGGVVEDLLTADPIVAVDTRLDNLLFAFRDPTLVKVFLWVSQLGRAQVVAATALTVCGLLFLRRRQGYILPFLVTLGGSTATALLGKVAFQRPRPAGIAVYPEWSYSFPSGHAVIATALYGFVVYLLWRGTEPWGRRLNILFSGLLLMVALGFSRLYLGVHFLSDVLGGYLLGLLWLIIGISLAEWRPAGTQAGTGPAPFARRAAAALLLAGLAAVFIRTGLRPLPVASPPAGPAATVPIAAADIAQGFSRYHLPRRTESITGEKQEPLGLIVTAGSDGALAAAFRAGGWRPAEPVSLLAVARGSWQALRSGFAPSAPIAPAFWHGQPNDFGFVRPVALPGGAPARDEARLWRTPLRTGQGRVYVGVAERLVGYEWGLFPEKGADLDQPRDELLRSLLGSGLVAAWRKIPLSPPTAGETLTGNRFVSDGAAWFIAVRP